MRDIRTICFAMVLFASLSGFALTETVNGVTWTYTVSNGGACLGSSSSSSPAVPTSTSGALVIPSVLGGYSVTTLGSYAFRNCTRLTSVTVPQSVTSIQDSAFNGCSGLTSMTLPFVGLQRGNRRKREALFGYIFGNSYYSGGIKMTSCCTETSSGSSFYIPSALRKVVVTDETLFGYGAFSGLSGLTSIVIGDSVTSIEAEVFSGCSDLTNVVVGKGMTSIGSYAFRGCSQLVALRFEGNCPAAIGENVFTDVASYCHVYVLHNSTGWGVTIPGTWNGFPIDWALSTDWTQCIVRFNANGGACATSDVSIGHFTVIGELPVPTWDNATFIGWFTETDGGTRIEESTLVTYDMTLYAHWELHTNGCICDLKNGEVTIVKCSSPDGDVLIPEEINGCPIVAIGAKAFSGCTNLTSVTMPDRVTSIGDSAFDGCSNLLSVVVGVGVTNVGTYAFRGTPFYNNLPDGLVVFGKVAYEMRGTCPSAVEIPDGVAIIGNSVFSGCSGMTSVTIPNSVTSIGSYAFSGCSGLTSVTIPDGVTIIESSAFSRCSGLTSVTIPDGVTIIEHGMFNNCSGLVDVTIPDGVTSIGDSAFMGCSRLTNMTIPASVTNIESYAFSGCRGLTSMSISNGVASIGSYAFRDCIGLANVTIPDSVTIIGEAAFSGCTNLTSMILPFVGSMRGNSGTSDSLFGYIFGAWNRRYPRMAFDPTPQYYSDFGRNGCVSNCIPVSLKTVIITDETSIGYGAFSNCTNLTCVTLSQGITNIGDYSFYGSSSVRRGRPAIYEGLTNITIPGNVERIGQYAFANCKGLTNVIFYGDAPQVEGNTFSTVPSVCQGYVRRLSSGWGVSVPGRWNNININYFDIYHDVSLDPNGGECSVDKVSVAEGMEIGTLQVPTREHYTFLGWFTSAYGGEELSSSFMGTDDITLYAHWLAEPVVVSDSGLAFRTDSCEVSISCATDGATIYYTDDGTTPKRYEDYLYTGPVTIAETTTFKAVAVVGGIRSAYVTVTITKKPLTMEEVLDVGDGVVVATSTSHPWRPILDSNAKVGDATARSGEIGNRTNTWLSASVSGAGTMSFWCKVSCEHDDEDLFTCDRLMVYTNGVEITDWRMDGETGWTQRELTFAGGENTVKWVYYKDKSDTAGEDCAWVDGVVWTPAGGSADTVVDMGGGKSVTVPGDWLTNITERIEAEGGDVVAALASTAANGRMSVAECYVVGVDPEKADEDFKIVSITIGADGTPVVEFDPPQAEWNVSGARAVLKGAATLEGTWQTVTEENKAGFRFFKLVVELP